MNWQRFVVIGCFVFASAGLSIAEDLPRSVIDSEAGPAAIQPDELILDSAISNDSVESSGGQCLLIGENSPVDEDLESEPLQAYLCSVSATGCRERNTGNKVVTVDCVGLNRQQCLAHARNSCEDELTLDAGITCPQRNGECEFLVRRPPPTPVSRVAGDCLLSLATVTKIGAIVDGAQVDAITGVISRGSGRGTCSYNCQYRCQRRNAAT